MLRLTLMRHANAGWGEEGLSDFDRSLDTRGRNDAPDMGAYMVKKNITPDLILCSAALRTRETFELLNTTAEFEGEVRFLEELYLIGETQLTKLLRNISSDFKHIFVLAHNPGIHDMVVSLASPPSIGKLSRLVYDFPTSSMVAFVFDISSWTELKPGTGKLIELATPALLASR